MDPGSLLSGIGAIGGLFGKKPKVISSADNIISLARGVRTASEETGINMAALLQAGAGSGPTVIAPGMSSSGADAAMALGDLIGTMKPAQKLAQLQSTVEAQAKKLNNYQLRPVQPGVYARRAAQAATAAAMIGSSKLATKPIPGDADYIGPRQPVKVFNPLINKWIGIHAGMADRLELQPGMVFTAEDNEAILGDGGSEIPNAANAATEAMGFGNTFHGIDMGPKPPKNKKAKPTKPPLRKGFIPGSPGAGG